MFAFNSVVIVVFVIGFVILLLFVVLDFLGLVFALFLRFLVVLC